MKQVDASPVFDRLISWSLDHPFAAPIRYGVASFAVLSVAILRGIFLAELLPWLFYVPTILLVGLLLGRGTGLYATALATMCGAISIARPGAVFWLTGPQWLACGLFAVVGIGVVLVAGELRAAFRRGRILTTRLLERDEQRELLNRELGHRMKNLLTVVQAIVGQTLRQSADLGGASEAVSARLAALGKVTTTLSASDDQVADLHRLAQDALGAHDSNRRRVTITGPTITLHSQLALAFMLAFHELVTNATKYGALSNDDGHIYLSWTADTGPNPEDLRFRLIWREQGGPPVHEPTRRGFGSIMIERSLRSYLRGTTAI